MIDETTAQYVERVGSAYALLMYKKQSAHYSKKLEEVRGALSRIESELDMYFDKAAEDPETEKDERWLEIAFRAQESDLLEKHNAEISKCGEAVDMAVPTPSGSDYRALAISAGFSGEEFDSACAEIAFSKERNEAI